MKQLWAPWRMTYVTGQETSDAGCFICAAVANAAAELVVERAPLTISLLNRFPYSPGHLMIAPARHVADPSDATDPEAAALFAGLQRALRVLRGDMHPEGFNVGLNLGSVAGASVEHLHLHVVPRWGGDTNFMPVLGDVKVLPEHLRATSARLRDAFGAL